MAFEEDTSPEIETALRQLALVDRIIGLEAQLADLQMRSGGESLVDEIAKVKASATWRVGRIVLAPVRLLRGLRRRS